MKKIISLAVIMAAVATMTGCTTRVVDLTVASTKNYNINSNKFVMGKRVTGEDKKPVVIFPLGIPSVKDATDRAIQQDKCAVGLSDVAVYDLQHHFLFGSFGYRVEGTQIIDRGLPGCENHAAN